MNKLAAMKKTGLKGALRVYKVIYDTDKATVLLIFPIALLRAVKPYISLLVTAYVLGGLAEGGDFVKLLTVALTGVGLNFVVDLITGYLEKLRSAKFLVVMAKIDMARREKYLSMDYQLLESPAVNDINARIERDSNWGGGFYNCPYYLQSFLSSAFGFAVGAVMLIPFLISVGLTAALFTVALLVFALGAAVINKRIQRKLTDHLSTQDPKYNMKQSMYYVYGGGSRLTNLLKTARIYNVRPLLEDILHEDAARQRAFNWVFTKYSMQGGFFRALTSGAMTAGAYLFVVARAVAGAVSPANVVRYAGTIYNMANGFFSLSTAIAGLTDQTDRIQSTLELMEVQNVLYKGTLPVEKRSDNEYELEFRGVSFKYPGSDSWSLRDFSLKLNVGQRLAIVGMNGSGKTTMIKLLCRLYDPTEGVITLNGIDIRKYDYAEYMSIFSVVFQDFKIFSFKLSENIACSDEIDAEKAAAACEKVGLGERLSRMEAGLDTYLYNNFDKGVEISGGEAQKVALARALYKGAPFIVLDEPTAALDPIAEFEIYSKFDDIVGERTAIYISHRLSSCRFCDDIAVFHGGRLVQRGSHGRLLEDAGGKYFELWNAQAQYYTENAE